MVSYKNVGDMITPRRRASDVNDSRDYKKRSWVGDALKVLLALMLGGGVGGYTFSDSLTTEQLFELRRELHELTHELEDIKEKIDVLLQR